MLMNTTIAGLWRPDEKLYAVLYDILLVVVGSLVIALCAQLAIRLPFSPVPITGQTFAVLMVGALFGARRGGLSVATYIIEGVAGLPVFASGASGFMWLLGPTGGYLLGFLPACCITGLLAERGWDRKVGTTIIAMVLGNIAIYVLGVSWLCCLAQSGRLQIGNSILAVGLYPFIIGDLLKIAVASVLLPSGWRLLKYSGFADRINRNG